MNAVIEREPLLQRRLAWLPFAMPLWIALLMVVALFGNITAWFGLGLLPDEAYYWVWSQRPQLSYFDHPPLIAWLMLPGAWLFDDAGWALRLPAVASWLVGALLGYRMAQQIFGGVSGALALLVWASLPIMQAGFHIVTPDSALMLFTWLGLWAAWRAGQESGARWWLLTGLFIGLALLAKYPAVLLLGALFFTLISTRDGQRLLATPWPWLGCLLALLLFLPVVVWNGANDWVSFRFQFGHGVKPQASADTLKLFSMFLGGQLAVAMPWSYFAMLWAPFSRALRSVDGYTRALLSWNFGLPMVIFGIAGLTASSGPNWPVSAYAAGTLLLAGWLNGVLYKNGQVRRGAVVLVIALFLLPQLVLNFMRFPAAIMGALGAGVPPQRTQLSQAYGWDNVAPALNTLLAQHPRGEACYILADNHARVGMIAWLMRMPMRVDATMSARISQYTLWREKRQGEPAEYCLFVKQYDSEDKATRAAIPQSFDLPEGHFLLEKIIEADNPDASLRWLAIYSAIQE
jgi:4-amino-4-deoxy-L-arabinose transferase-like glycosyltransferase